MSRIALLILLFLSQILQAQVLDDSTKLLYSTKTVKFFYEKEVFKNQNILHRPDTSLTNFQNVENRSFKNQDLGNIGSPTFSIIPNLNSNLERQKNNNIYNDYKLKKEDIQYFNTLSPYTSLDYTQSSKGFSKIIFLQSQNVNERLNFTFSVNKYNSAKQYGTTGQEDKLADYWNYYLSSNYKSKNEKYVLLSSIYHTNQKFNEQGGILEKGNLSTKPSELLANYKSNYDVRLTKGVYNRELSNNVYIYQEYQLKKAFQIFNTWDFGVDKHIFENPEYALNDSLVYRFENLKLINDTLTQLYKVNSGSGAFGFKGLYKKINYDLYTKIRLYGLNNKIDNSFNFSRRFESFIGGSLAYYFKDSLNILLANAEFSSNLGYYINGNIRYKGLIGSFSQSFTPPNIMFENFGFGNFRWKNDFQNIFQTQISASYPLQFKNIKFEPKIVNTAYANYIYFNEKLKPSQLSSGLNVLNILTNIEFSGKRIFIKNELLLSQSSNNSVYAVPAISNFTNLEFSLLYAKVLRLYLGADIIGKSRYRALNYSPLLADFYNASTLTSWGTFMIDPYVKFNVNKVRLALKFTHANQGIPNQGFYASPLYLNNPRTFYLHVNWPLFD